MTEHSFPDQFAVEFIRSSLWSKAGSRASIMVGSGFSRNARPTSPSAREMPTWSQMAKALCILLYADASKDSYERALNEASSTSGFLRLAQEYKAAFGQSALNEQIRALVPDLEYDPSRLHKMLLQLPWTDVLTTNWDTLLERASLDVFDENYDVIRTHSEIASSTRPRIIKLHGTLPAHEPFIFTEDDYRTYPRLHAPFVNLVQQTLMESTLCLIGFSGDDPNFLHWSGWVRDNLGANAPKIYLVGWLELTPSRKRMLEDRNVVPIDLSALPIASTWPRENRHRFATEWFLQSISTRERYQPEAWPYLSHEELSVPAYLGKIAQPPERLPKEEPLGPSGAGAFNTNPAELSELMEIWRWNRSIYPNWAIAPSPVRNRIWMYTYQWVHPILRLQSTMHPYQFLYILEELTWRLDLSLAPHLPELQQPIADCLNCFNFSEQSISKSATHSDCTTKIHWPDLRTIWATVALNLIRATRISGDFDSAHKIIKTIEFISTDIITNEISYEKLLIARDSANLSSLFDEINKWDVSGIDSIWASKKAGLLAGLGYFKDALNIVNRELANNRKNRRRDIIDYASYSREAWLLWMEDALDSKIKTNIGLDNIERRKFLRSIGCDILRDFNELIDRLAVELNKKRKPETGFYRNSGESFSFRNGLEDDFKTAIEILQFHDKTGLPRSMLRYSVLGPGLRLASSALQETEPYISAIANIRGADTSSDEKLDFWTRNRIASLSDLEFSKIYSIVLAELEFALSAIGEIYNGRWRTQLQISVEVLARLSIRVSPKQAEQMLETILRLIRSEKCIFDPGMFSPIRNLIGNVFYSVSTEFLERIIIEFFLGKPIPDINFPEFSYLFPSQRKFSKENHIHRDNRWTGVIADLLNSISSDNDVILSISHSRIRLAENLGILTQDEIEKISHQFWEVICENFTNWQQTNVQYPWANLYPPCSKPKLRNNFYKNIFLRKFENGGVSPIVAAIGMAREILLARDEPIELNVIDFDLLREAVIGWCRIEYIPPNPGLYSYLATGSNREEFQFIIGLVSLFPDLNLEKDVVELIYQKTKMISTHIPVALRLLPFIANYHPERAKEAEDIIKGNLVSDDTNLVQAACNCLWIWMDRLKEGKLQVFPSGDILYDVGKIIGSRKMSSLVPALGLGTWIVENGNDSARQYVLRESEIGMALLYSDLEYNGRLAKQGADVSNIRKAVAQFSLAIVRHYIDAPKIFHTIIFELSEDKIIEVKNAALGNLTI
jgi:hypothetical protein